jgi:hypothetical protein
MVGDFLTDNVGEIEVLWEGDTALSGEILKIEIKGKEAN